MNDFNKNIEEKPSSLENKNHSNNNENNYGKINVKKIDNMTNYKTNNSINIKLILENKIIKNEEICFNN